jgi:hypothetical protein
MYCLVYSELLHEWLINCSHFYPAVIYFYISMKERSSCAFGDYYGATYRECGATEGLEKVETVVAELKHRYLK